MNRPHDTTPQAGDPCGDVVQSLPHDRSRLDALAERLIAEMRGAGYGEAECFAVRLAWEEAVSNAIHHGNRDRPDGRLEIAYRVSESETCLRITDEGAGFDPDSIVDPTLDENLDCPSGRGLLLMRAYMTSIEFVPPGNTVRMIRRRTVPPDPQSVEEVSGDAEEE